MDIIATHNSNGKYRDFWEHTKKCCTKPNLSVRVQGESDFYNIANIFREYFKMNSPLTQLKNAMLDAEHALTTSVKNMANLLRCPL